MDWLVSLFYGGRFVSDYYNVFKLGYNFYNLIYFDWLKNVFWFVFLFLVIVFGKVIFCLFFSIVNVEKFFKNYLVCVGIMDSIVVFLVSGVM